MLMSYDDIERWIGSEREEWGDFLSPDEFEDYVFSQFPTAQEEGNEELFSTILRGLGL